MGHTLYRCSQDRDSDISQLLPLQPDDRVYLSGLSGVETKACVP